MCPQMESETFLGGDLNLVPCRHSRLPEVVLWRKPQEASTLVLLGGQQTPPSLQKPGEWMMELLGPVSLGGRNERLTVDLGGSTRAKVQSSSVTRFSTPSSI